MDEKPKRRWLRFAFSLRMLLIFVALAACACWPLSQWRIVHQRQAIMRDLAQTVGADQMKPFDGIVPVGVHDDVRPPASLPYLRSYFGDVAYSKISMPLSVNPQQVDRVGYWFPEAEIEVNMYDDVQLFRIWHKNTVD